MGYFPLIRKGIARNRPLREGIAPNPYLLDCLLWIKSRLTDSKLEIIEDSWILFSGWKTWRYNRLRIAVKLHCIPRNPIFLDEYTAAGTMILPDTKNFF